MAFGVEFPWHCAEVISPEGCIACLVESEDSLFPPREKGEIALGVGSHNMGVILPKSCDISLGECKECPLPSWEKAALSGGSPCLGTEVMVSDGFVIPLRAEIPFKPSKF